MESKEHEKRLSKLLTGDLEKSIHQDNINLNTDVESALTAAIKRRASPINTTSKYQSTTLEEELLRNDPFDSSYFHSFKEATAVRSRASISNSKHHSTTLEEELLRNDPFDPSYFKSFKASKTITSSSSTKSAKPNTSTTKPIAVKESQYSLSLAQELAVNDPFTITQAISDVSNQFRHSLLSNIDSSSGSTSCVDTCSGCKVCDGVDYINSIRIEEKIDDYMQAVDEEDGGFFETDEGIAVDTDDECMELNKYLDVEVDEQERGHDHIKSTSSSSKFSEPYDVWNSKGLSFWELRHEGGLLRKEDARRKQQFNSSCGNCFTSLHCQTCEVNMQNPSAKKSANYIKEFAMRTTLMELGNLSCSARSCRFGRDCLRKLSIGQVHDLRKRFFGSELEEAPKDKERKAKAIEILDECYDSFQKTFVYRILRLDGVKYDEVCEGAFLVALGKLGNMKANQVSKSWQAAKREVMGLNVDVKVRPSKDFKLQHAGGYIDFVTNLFVHQDPMKTFSTMQTIGETSPLAGYGKLIILPYDNLKQFHHEYVVHSFSRGFAAQFIAGYTTFSMAFKQRENVRFLGAKGSFNTCEICNSLNNLLKNTRKKLKKEQIRIIQEFKRLHIGQQSIERKKLEVNKELSLEVDDTGQPQQGLIFIDGMTELKGNSPKLGATRTSKVDHVIANRVIGVEVYCGPINTVFLYNTDQMVGKGANTMIEIVRQYLQTELQKNGLHMPSKMLWQFDNCGENKNKTMFGYASALVELGYFEAIDINFLIVGHTHSSIDQYFSVLSKAIAKSEFIGSPLSMQALCSQAHRDRARPAVNRQIEACYNIVDALKPYINKKIKFFQVPHCFSFRRRGNKCVMFYKLFSSHPNWLPAEPDLSLKLYDGSKSSSSKISEQDKILCAVASPSNQIAEVEIEPLANFGGKEAFLSHIGISGENKSTYLINNKEARNKIDAIDSVLPIVMDGEVVALHNLETRTMMEESEGHLFEHKELIKVDLSQPERLLIQNAMKSVSSSLSKKGYIIWIVDSPDLPPLNSLTPKIIYAGASLHLSPIQETQFQRLKKEQNQSLDAIPDAIETGLIEIPDNDDDDNAPQVVMEENLFERTNKSFQQRARDIVSVAKKALDHINQTKEGINLDYSYFPDKLDFDESCWADRSYIAPEKIYFEKRQSMPHYKLFLETIAIEALQTPWQFFCTKSMDEEMIKRVEKELENAKQAALAMKNYLTNLQKTGLAVKPGVEVIARDGYTMTTAQLEELQTLVSDERDRSRRGNRGRAALLQSRGRGRSRGVAQQSYDEQQLSPSITQVVAMSATNNSGEGTSGRAGRGRGGTRGGRVDVRNRRVGGGKDSSVVTTAATTVLINREDVVSVSIDSSELVEVYTGDGSPSTRAPQVVSQSESKRKRCDINQCVEYCDEIIHPVCLECGPSNQSFQFCSMHIPHKSHSEQSGFVVELVQQEISGGQSCLINNTNADCDPVTASISATERKILRLFKEGFNQSSKSNISPEQKVVGALNHSCYKSSLHVIASFYGLCVDLPDNDSLCRTGPRENYLKALVCAYIAKQKATLIEK